MKSFADKRRTEREFVEGEWVYLRLQPYKQTSLALRKDFKLAPRFYGPFQILKRIRTVAYKLQLPSHSKIHLVFHVSLLKKKLGALTVPIVALPDVGTEGHILIKPVAVLEQRMVRKGNVAVTQVLVQWANSFPKDATWEEWTALKEKFPQFKP